MLLRACEALTWDASLFPSALFDSLKLTCAHCRDRRNNCVLIFTHLFQRIPRCALAFARQRNPNKGHRIQTHLRNISHTPPSLQDTNPAAISKTCRFHITNKAIQYHPELYSPYLSISENISGAHIR